MIGPKAYNLEYGEYGNMGGNLKQAYEDEGNDVDLDKSKVKLKLAPALGTSSVWGLGGHHARDQGNLGDRDQRGF